MRKSVAFWVFLLAGTQMWAGAAITEILGRPTSSSITLNVLPDAAVDVYSEYGAEPSVYTAQTATTTTAANAPVELTMNGLQANRRYYYWARYRSAGTSDPYTAGTEHTFITQRLPCRSFVFGVQGDSHPERLNNQFFPDRYTQTMLNVASERPDFYVLMGDDFSIDNITKPATQSAVIARYTLQIPYLTQIANSSPLFLVNGNHEQAARYLYLSTTEPIPNNPAVWAQNARNSYFPQPVPDSFYTGNPEILQYIGLLRNYFAWTWGDALFVCIDPYWESPVVVDNDYYGGPKTSDKWLITHSDAQYWWLKSTLEQSKAKYKFVFAHHAMGTGRGGAQVADRWEWGGRNASGVWEFDIKRQTPPWPSVWPVPIHQLMVDNHVSIFFHGHDHLYAKEDVNGVVYQECPQPADYEVDGQDPDNLAGYPSPAVTYTNGGHLRVSVSPTSTTVEYVRTQIAGDGVANGRISYTYRVYPNNHPPSFSPDPIVKPDATATVPYADSIAGDASDPDVGETLTFSKVDGPGWLFVSTTGTLTGLPSLLDAGLNSFVVRVEDASGSSTQAALHITVQVHVNHAPSFTSDTLVKPAAQVNVPYNNSIAGDASDPDPGDTLSFSKVNGPGWLLVSTTGTLTGTPPLANALNTFTVRVEDEAGSSAQAALLITVRQAEIGSTVQDWVRY